MGDIMGDQKSRVCLRDIARAAGCSHATVSLALRGDLRISSTRRRLVAEVAQRLGYTPDPMLASLCAYRRSKKLPESKATIAWLNQWPVKDGWKSYREYQAYWDGAVEHAATLGYRLDEIVITSEISSRRLAQILRARGVRGILIPPHQKGLDLQGFDWSLYPVVRLGSSVSSPPSHIVAADQLKGAMIAFERMWSRGFRKIAYVSAREFERRTGGNFHAGFLQAQHRFVDQPSQLPPVYLEHEQDSGKKTILREYLASRKVDSFITAVARLPEILRAIGYKVPEDIGVAALSVLDGSVDAGLDQNSVEVGRVAIATLADMISRNERGPPRHCRRALVEGRWVDGSSAARGQLTNSSFLEG